MKPHFFYLNSYSNCVVVHWVVQSLTSSFPIFICFMSFCYLKDRTKTLSSLLNKKGADILVSPLTLELMLSVCLHFSIMVATVLLYTAFIIFWYDASTPNVSRTFMLNFVKCLFWHKLRWLHCSTLDFLYHTFYLLLYIYWVNLASPGWSPLEHMIFLMYSGIQFEIIWLRTFASMFTK